jgi:penicillin-binding protein 1A
VEALVVFGRSALNGVSRARLTGALLFLAPPLLAAPAAAQEGREPWRIIQPSQSSLVFARDGSLIAEIGRQARTSVPLASLPKYVAHAFVAVEDKRFYQHDGVDIVGVGGALKDAVLGDPRGASTITQQLVGNMHPDIIDRRDRGIGRKLREQQAAREMERHYSKEQILEAYINLIHFGHGWYGIDAAARHYFGKPAAKLTLAETATLAALPKGPAIYSPISHPDAARRRRNVVLSLMAEQGYITGAQSRAAQATPIRTAPNRGLSASAPYFVDVVTAQAEQAGISLAQGGFRVYTTLDPALQRAAASELADGLKAVEARPGYRHPTFANRAKGSSDYLQGAVVAVDPASGDVRALVGGRDYQASRFNRAVNGLRQPGSSFKPFVYAAAIADSIPPNALVADTALAIPLDDGTVYEPENADDAFRGEMTMREALAHSRNPVAVQLALHVGLDNVAELAQRAGIETPIDRYPSTAIGASAVRPLDFVTAFAAFANGGVAVDPRFVRRVEDSAGRTIWTPTGRTPELAIDPRVAFIVRDMMRDVVERGTATVVRRLVPAEVPVAGKTGTTNDNTDVWFVGMTPELVAGVWLGFDRPKTIMAGAAGGTLAAPIWGRMVADAYRRRESREWVMPAGVVTAELDRQSGLPADPFTPPERRYTEYFLAGTEPGAIPIDAWRLFEWGPVGF